MPVLSSCEFDILGSHSSLGTWLGLATGSGPTTLEGGSSNTREPRKDCVCALRVSPPFFFWLWMMLFRLNKLVMREYAMC